MPNCDIGKVSIIFVGCCLRAKGHGQVQRMRGLEDDGKFVSGACITLRPRAWECYCLQRMRWTPVGESCVECSSRPRRVTARRLGGTTRMDRVSRRQIVRGPIRITRSAHRRDR